MYKAYIIHVYLKIPGSENVVLVPLLLYSSVRKNDIFRSVSMK